MAPLIVLWKGGAFCLSNITPVFRKILKAGILLLLIPSGMMCALLYEDGHLYKGVDIPPIGSSASKLKESMGEPAIIETSQTSKIARFDGTWTSRSDGRTCAASQLPSVQDERRYYVAGIMGTHCILVYIKAGKITAVFEQMT